MDTPKPLPHATKVGVFWDYENCQVPRLAKGYDVVDRIRNVVLSSFGAMICFNAYLDIMTCAEEKRIHLSRSGVSLIHCPHDNRKDMADAKLMVDMLTFAIDNPAPATIVLISGDKDFCSALSVLRNRNYFIVLIEPMQKATSVMRAQASVVLDWKLDVLEGGSKGVDGNAKAGVDAVSPAMSPPLVPVDMAAGLASNLEAMHLVSQSTNELEFFEPLIDTLKELYRLGNEQPRRSDVGSKVLERNPLIYKRGGCAGFKDLTRMAKEAGLVELGGQSGTAWIALSSSAFLAEVEE
ncbi:hypothetical protein HDU98_003794 [Podochytrium sp. JEL0797]|nr:hypothetical protein HDU98_003794 [Podochytrium sp. JEL0797]